MVKTSLISLSAITLLATSILFLFFIILPGATSSTPFDKTYFLRADTSGITGARPTSQWSYLYVCGPRNRDCTHSHAAYPFGLAWASRASNVPPALIGSHGHHTTSFQYYYLWRFSWVFILLALFFDVVAFFLALFTLCCGRLGAAVACLLAGTALFFYSIAAAMTTATFVKARNQFHHAHRAAKVGPWGLGFLWGGYAALLIATLLFALAIRSHPSRRRHRNRSLDGRRVKDQYS